MSLQIILTQKQERLLDDIKRLEYSTKRSADFAKITEGRKFRDTSQSDNRVDKGFVGKKSAKMMKRSLVTQNRKEKAINEKSKLLKNIDVAEALQMNPLDYRGNTLVYASNLKVQYDGENIFDSVDFVLNRGDILHLRGDNGSGKSSIIKLILGEEINYTGALSVGKNVKISYVSQDTSYLKGDLLSFAEENAVDESIFKSVLIKLGFEQIQFGKNMEDFSEGQKKKVLLAKSLLEESHLYLWDEPLNYIDILSRMQIEDVILECSPTMIFVEHDELFSENITTKEIVLKKTKEKELENDDNDDNEKNKFIASLKIKYDKSSKSQLSRNTCI